MEGYRYSESGQLNSVYNEYFADQPEHTVEFITEIIKSKMEIWQGACKEVLDNDELDVHEYNALYELYKEALTWYIMDKPASANISLYFPRKVAKDVIRTVVPSYIENVYGKEGLRPKAMEKYMVALLGGKTAFAPNILREAYWDARVDIIRWGVAEKLEECGYMN